MPSPLTLPLSSGSSATWWPASATLAVPFILIRNRLRQSARFQVNWLAAFLTAAIFECLMIYAEHFSLVRGHWIYNRARILGPEIWGIPIEEPLIYYWLGPLFTITLWGALRHYFERRLNDQRGVS